MAQLTIRLPDELARRIRAHATHRSASMNEYVVAVLDACTDPTLAGSEADRVRERMSLAGLLDDDGRAPRGRPNRRAVAAARAAAGRGTSLSGLVSSGRE